MAAKKEKDFGTASRGLLGLNNILNDEDNKTDVTEQGSVETDGQNQEIKLQHKNPDDVSNQKISGKTKGKKEIRIKTSVELSEENLKFIEDIKTIEGGSIRTVLNGLLDDLRISKRAALDKALEIHNQGRKTWKDM